MPGVEHRHAKGPLRVPASPRKEKPQSRCELGCALVRARSRQGRSPGPNRQEGRHRISVSVTFSSKTYPKSRCLSSALDSKIEAKRSQFSPTASTIEHH